MRPQAWLVYFLPMYPLIYKVTRIISLGTFLWLHNMAEGTLRAQDNHDNAATWDLKVFPHGELFLPLIADPTQPMFRLGVLAVDSDLDQTWVGLAAVGETFGLFRLIDTSQNRALQLDVSGGVFSQFDLLGESSDLINADYLIGMPITYRHSAYSMRLRFYHQSSHLGDEFLLRNNPPRINLSFESLELLLSAQFRSLRLYGGGEYLVRTDPDDLDSGLLHLGAEYLHATPLIRFKTDNICRALAALDAKLWQENSYEPSVNLKLGIELGTDNDPRQEERTLRILLEGYRGLAPYGQFFTQSVQIWSYGLEIQLSL